MGFVVWGLWFVVCGLGFGVWGLGFGVWGLKFWAFTSVTTRFSAKSLLFATNAKDRV